MKQKRETLIPCRLFWGDTPFEELTDEERADFGRIATERMGRTLNDCFNRCPENYARLLKSLEK